VKVTAIMPTFNQKRYLQAALDTVVDQVDELIVVDDGSTDGTEELLDVNKYLVVRHEENRGTAEAINTGLRYATGDLLTWVSSDNVLATNWREKLEEPFTDDVGVTYSAFDYGGRYILRTEYEPDKLIKTLNCFFGPSFLIRREVWLEAGLHRGKISHDYDHWLRVEEACWSMDMRIVGVPDSLCFYRVHDQRVTVTRRNQFDAPHWRDEAKKRRARRET